MASSYTILSGVCIWIMVISRGKTFLCQHGMASVVLVKVLILSCVSWPVCLTYKRHDGSVSRRVLVHILLG